MNEVLVALLRCRVKYVEVFILPESHWHNFCGHVKPFQNATLRFFLFILYCYPEVVCCEIKGIVIKFSVRLFNSIIVIQVIERHPAQRMYFRGKRVWAMSVRTEHSCGFIYHIHALSVLYIKFWLWVRLKPPMEIFLLISLFVFIRDIWRTHFISMYDMLVWLWSSKGVWVQSWWLTV